MRSADIASLSFHKPSLERLTSPTIDLVRQPTSRLTALRLSLQRFAEFVFPTSLRQRQTIALPASQARTSALVSSQARANRMVPSPGGESARPGTALSLKFGKDWKRVRAGEGKSGSEVLVKDAKGKGAPGQSERAQLKVLGANAQGLGATARLTLEAKRAFKGDTEVTAEVIAARFAKAMAEVAAPGLGLVPDVEPLFDDVSGKFALTSAYVKGSLGNLDQFFDTTMAAQPGRGHVQIKFDASGVSLARAGKYVPLGEAAAKDIIRHLLDSARIGDHDVNPGNFLVVERGGELRIARIDFGHAGNDLVASAHMNHGARGAGGTGENRSIDFFTRERVLGGQSKIQRDFPGVMDSPLFREILEERAAAGKSAGSGPLEPEVVDQLASDLRSVLGEMEAAGPPTREGVAALHTSLTHLMAKIGGKLGSRPTTAELIGHVTQRFADFVLEGASHEAGLLRSLPKDERARGLAVDDSVVARPRAQAVDQKPIDPAQFA